MNRVTGKVLVKETGIGVPDVLVVAFDVDTHSTPATTATPSAAAVSFSEGNRLGSVLTDAQGDFELAFEDAIFAIDDKERRPDLVVGVLAPEEPRNADDPTTLPPDLRLLVFSRVPRTNAGRVEAYIFRVPVSVLRKHAIRFLDAPGKAGPAAPAKRLVEAHASTDQLDELLRSSLAPKRRALLKRTREIRKAAKKFAKPLGASPLAIRSNSTFITAKEGLPAAQRAAMKSGLESLKAMVQNRPMLYEVTRADFAEAGLMVVEPAPVYEFDHEQVCRLIRRRGGGAALERILDLVAARKVETEARDRVDRATASADEPGGKGDSESGGDGDSDGAGQSPPLAGPETVTAAVLGQLADLTAPSAAPASSIDELSERLTGFTLPPGPADVTSFHDFQQLQIAFEHVWTEAFDQDLKECVQQVYQDTVALHDEFGETGELPEEVQEQEDLERFLQEFSVDVAMVGSAPAVVQTQLPDAAAQWHLYTPAQWVQLTKIAEQLEALSDEVTPEPRNGALRVPRWALQHKAREGASEEKSALLAQAQAIVPPPQGTAGRLIRLLDETRKRLTEPYAFHYFAPNSINFGILLTYRQKWEPLKYQVGDLVATIPLAPGETRTFSSKTVVKRSRAEKEMEKALSSRSGESSLTQRAEAEITGKASTTTNFKSTAQGSFNIGIGSLEATAEFVLNQAQESARTKRDFREAVVKAAHEYKLERTMEVETTTETARETTSSGELANTNNERTVTYLLYELQRQYRISERIHRVTPVVLVAQDVPGPHEITESWLLAHDWILKRVLLDDGFRPALDQLKESFAGSELSVKVKEANWETQKRVVYKLETTVSDLLSQRDVLRAMLISGQESRALAKAAENAQGFLVDFAEELTTDIGEAAVDVIEARIKSVQRQLEFLQESLDDSQRRLATARDAMDSATKAYSEALEQQINRHVAIDQLRVHVKENILYYMQAIWDHEPPDQRFFRLYYQPVELPESPTQVARLRRATEQEIALGIPTVRRGGDYYVVEDFGPPVLAEPGEGVKKKLVEIADLDRPLGYKGNYIIFPLKTCVYLTEFMMKQFVDGYFGLRDPDADANITTDELIAYVEAIWGDKKIKLSQSERDALHDLVLSRIREPRREADVVVVPSGQIYIEALLGSHPLLEDFKLIHRAYDVGKARAELRKAELDNLRRAARLLAEEPDLGDPDIDKRVVIEGASVGVVTDDG